MLNRADFVGRITSQPQTKSIQSRNGSTDLCNFTIAVDRDFKNRKTGDYDADFIRCTAWGPQADFLKNYIQKGSLISVDGQIRTRRAPDKKNPGHYRYFTGVHVDELNPCSSRNSGQSNQSNYQTSSASNSNNSSASANNENDSSASNSDNSNLGDKKVDLKDDDLPF